MEQEILNAYLQTLNQIEHNLSYRLESVETISLNLLRNSDLYEYLLENPDRRSLEQGISNTLNLRKLVKDIQRNNDIFWMRIYANNDNIYTRDGINFFPFSELKKTSYYNVVCAGEGKAVWLDTHMQEYTGTQALNVISCSRMIRNPNNFDKFIAALLLDVPEKNIYDILANIGNEMEQYIYLIGPNGNIVSHVDKSLIGCPVVDINTAAGNLDGTNGVIEYGSGSEKGYILHSRLPVIDASVILIIPATSIAHAAREQGHIWFFTTIIFFVSFFILVVFFIMFIYSKQIDKKTEDLVMSMDSLHIKQQTLDKPINFTMLETSVNSLINRTVELMDEVYQEKLNAKDIELRLLQAQINPHFLYNTIDTIYWMAMKRNAVDVADMLSTLAKYFRFSLNKGKNIVPIEDEIELIHSYIRIQRARFPGRFIVKFNIDETSKSFLIPKLTLQPLIENSLIHGILPSDTFGVIIICIQCKDNGIHFQIEDNGIGFKKDYNLSGIHQHSGYGLYSVNQRLILFNGSNAVECIHIHSSNDKGTLVSFSIVKKDYPLD